MLSRIRMTGALMGVLLLWGSHARAGDDAGYVLLEKVTTQIQQMGQQRAPDEAQLQAALDGMMASAKLAKAESRIDQEFFERYARVVRVIRVLTIKDPEGILLPLFEKEVSSFVTSVLGPQASGAAMTPMPEIARALKVELDALKQKLDRRK